METKELKERKDRLAQMYNELKTQKRIKSIAEFARVLNKSRSNASRALSGDERYLTEGFLEIVSEVYPQYTFSWLMDGDLQPNSNMREKKTKQTSIPYLDRESQKEYLNNYYSDEFLKLMPKIMTDYEDGRIVAFEVGDGAIPPYQAGDTVVCREVDRSKWINDLEIEVYDFVVAHTSNGVLLRDIIEHRDGLLICSDDTISLREVAHLYHIIEHRILAENIKKRRL